MEWVNQFRPLADKHLARSIHVHGPSIWCRPQFTVVGHLTIMTNKTSKRRKFQVSDVQGSYLLICQTKTVRFTVYTSIYVRVPWDDMRFSASWSEYKQLIKCCHLNLFPTVLNILKVCGKPLRIKLIW